MLDKKVAELLKHREFVCVATCDFEGHPNSAPKFLLKVEDGFIYLVDYIINRTWQNLKINPLVSLSFMDNETLTGYQINGSAEIIDSGQGYEKIVKELSQKKIDLSIKRVIEGIKAGRTHKGYEVGISERFVIFKVKIKELVEIGPSGSLNRQKL